MSRDAFLTTVKSIARSAREGDLETAYAGYRELFTSENFAAQAPADRRQALRLMVRGTDAIRHPTETQLDAHRAALGPLTELVSTSDEAGDYEMLGICHLFIGNEQAASTILRAGLALERERNPQSDLCGVLMKRVSLI
jgi:hypothetical protein